MTITAPSNTRLAPEVAADSKPVGNEGVEILKRLREISAIEKAARDVKDEKAELSARLASLTEGRKYATFQGVVVATRIDSHSTVTDTKTLAEAFPEAYAACVSKNPYSYYRQA